MKAPLARQDDPEAVPRKPRHARLQHRQHFVEQLWSRAVAAQRSPRQTLKTRNRPKQAETVALGFAPPHEHLDGKEGVDGSSPSEGSLERPANAGLSSSRTSTSADRRVPD